MPEKSTKVVCSSGVSLLPSAGKRSIREHSFGRQAVERQIELSFYRQ